MLSITPNTAYALCKIVDTGKLSLPIGWKAILTPPDPTAANPNYAAVFQYVDGTYALVIQGTKNKGDATEDLDVTTQKSFPYIENAQIAAGTAEAMENILKLALHHQHEPGRSVSLEDFLKGLPAESQLLITGHSLGGNVASAMAPWLVGNIAAFFNGSGPDVHLPQNLLAITFAAPTAGNAAFANFLDSQSNYQAHFNINDVVPHVWGTRDPLNAWNIENMFRNGPNPAPKEIWRIIKSKLETIESNGLNYTQTKGVFFEGKIQGGLDWMKEMSYQHNDAYDFHFLDAAIGET